MTVRVTLVCPYDLTVPGGVQSHVRHLADALCGLGDEAAVIGPGPADQPGRVGGSVRIPFNDSVAPIALDPRAVRRTLQAIVRTRPDVVHVHEPLVPWVGLAGVRVPGVPVVATFHAWSDRDRAYRLARPVGRGVLRRLAASVAVSEAAAGYHASALGVARSRFRIIPNGVDVSRFRDARPFEELQDPESPALLFVGRLERRKGLEPLIRAFTLLKTHWPRLRLLVVGDGPERDRCRRLLPARLRSDVVFLGRVDHDDLPRLYASAELFVSPALGGESFGIVLLEAMAAGRAIVASDIPGYRSVARDGDQGRLVPPGDPRALADAIGSLLHNPSLRRAMGEEGRRTVADYDWPVVARRLHTLYLEVTGR